jgi:hypothetical protein
MNCKHERKVTTKYPVYNQFTGDEETYDHIDTYSTFEDIDLHIYKCTQCGEIGYYSGAARDYYEKGIKSEVLRLQ